MASTSANRSGFFNNFNQMFSTMATFKADNLRIEKADVFKPKPGP